MDDNEDVTRNRSTDPGDPSPGSEDPTDSAGAEAGDEDRTGDGTIGDGSTGDTATAVTPPSTGATAPINVTHPKSRRGLYIGGAVALLAVVVVGVILFVKSQYGDPADALAAVPDNAVMVMGMDLLALTDEDSIEALVDTFEGAFAAAAEEGGFDVEATDDFIAGFEEMFNEETGIDLATDVYPWVGRSLAVAATDDMLTSVDSNAPEGILISLSVRDEQGAADFITGPLSEVMAEEGVTIAETGDGAWTITDGTPEATAHVRIASGMLMIAPDEAIFDDALAALDGERSLLDNSDYAAAMDMLPEGRSMFAWFDGRSFYEAALATDEITSDDFEELGITEEEMLDAFDVTVGMAAGLTPEGIVFDVVGTTGSSYLDGLPGAVVSPMLANIADDTVFFFGVSSDPKQSILDAWAASEENALLSTTADMQDLVDELEAELGTTLISDALSVLSGGFGLALGPSNTSIPVFGPDFDFAVAIGLDIVDPEAAEKLVVDLVDWAGAGELTLESAGLVDRVVTPDGQEFLSVSVTGDQIVVASDVATVGDAATGSSEPLVDSELYGDLDAELPGDGLVLYADVMGIASLFGADLDDPTLPSIDGVGISYVVGEGTFGVHGIVHYGEQDDGVGALGP